MPTNRIQNWTFDDKRDEQIAALHVWWAESVIACPQIEMSWAAQKELEDQWHTARAILEGIEKDRCRGQ